MWEMVNFSQLFVHTAILMATPPANASPLIDILVTVSEFEDLLDDNEANQHFIKSNYNYYKVVLNAIKEKFKLK